MKTVINILKGLEIVLTAIWGIIFGIFTPLSIMYADIVSAQIAEHYIVKVWLINSIVFYIAGTVLVMLKCYKVALCFHTAGLGVSLYIYSVFQDIYKGIEAENPAQLYLPIIFVTIITLFITLIGNYDKIMNKLLNRKKDSYLPAPSVLGGEYQADKISDKKTKRKSKKNAD